MGVNYMTLDRRYQVEVLILVCVEVSVGGGHIVVNCNEPMRLNPCLCGS